MIKCYKNDLVVWIMYICLLSEVVYLNIPGVTIANYEKPLVFYIIAMAGADTGYVKSVN